MKQKNNFQKNYLPLKKSQYKFTNGSCNLFLDMSENQNIEYKESWRDEYLKWICGFAYAKAAKYLLV